MSPWNFFLPSERRKVFASFILLANALLVHDLHAQTAAGGAMVDTEMPVDSTHLDQPAKTIDRDDDQVLQRHRPFYFAYGQPLSKLQLSFKTPMFRKLPLYFGYSQLMFWALEERSRPFRDLTYNPELFYRIETKNWGLIKSVDVGLWDHTSNGKRDLASRSFNRMYLRVNSEKEFQRWLLRASVQAGYLYGFDETNADIEEYVSPLSFSLTFIQLYDGWIDRSELGFQASPGGKWAKRWERGGYQASWAFRLGKLDLVPAFYFQYYSGYAETLLNYDQHVSEFRGGILF